MRLRTLTDDKPDIQKQLSNAQEQRERLKQQLKESESIIDSIETRLADITISQEARLRADDRVDNKLLDQVQNKKRDPSVEETMELSGVNGGKGKSKSKMAATAQQDKSKAKQTVIGTNSWYEIIVDEDGNKKERLHD